MEHVHPDQAARERGRRRVPRAPSPPSSPDDLPAIEVIKWKDVYDNMERSIDSCVAVAHVLESVVLKHS